MRVVRPSSVSMAVALAALFLSSADAVSAAELRVNGWYPCGFSSSDAGAALSPDLAKPFECAEVDVPLCHEGICQSDRTIPLFVKRLLANATKKAEITKSIYFLQGGPGGSSAAMEPPMQAVHRLLDYQANVYTVDHRGTGRSFFLQCDAAQAFNGGSPSGIELSLDEVPDCLHDVLFQIDNQTAAFSVTSAAKDLEFLTQNLHAQDEEVYVYGASYGTYLTERVMHLAPPNVKGYILDGVLSEDNASAAFTGRNTDNATPTKLIAKYCEEDEDCAAMYSDVKPGELYAKWQAMYKELDALKKGDNACADLFRFPTFGEEATMISTSIKASLGAFGNDGSMRPLVPALLKIIHRCQDEKDVMAIQSIVKPDSGVPSSGSGSSNPEETPAPAPQTPQAVDVVGGDSPILGFLIKTSEIWLNPSPTWADEMKVFSDAVLPQALITDFVFHCLFSGDAADPTCDSISVYSQLSKADYSQVKPVAFTYKTDKYFGKFASIPDHASALIINGKLDFQTMSENGVHQYENLDGGRGKMMVDMNYGGHCTGISPSTPDDTSECGVRIIASFVKESGDVEKVDTSCMEELPLLDMLSADSIIQTLAAQAGEQAAETATTAPETEEETTAPAKHKKNKFRHSK